MRESHNSSIAFSHNEYALSIIILHTESVL